MPFNHQNDSKYGKAISASEDHVDNATGYLNEEISHPNPLPSGSFEDGMSAKYIIDLDMLSVELEERTKETQKLQEVVEQASRLVLERMDPTFNNTDTTLDNISATNTELKGSKEYGISRPQSAYQPINYDDVHKTRCLNFPGRDVLEHAIEEYSQQVLDLQRQLRETYEIHEQQKCNFRQTIIELQTKLHENQIEKDAVVDVRLEEYGKHSELMGQLQEVVLELRTVKQEEAERRDEALTKRAEGAEQELQDVFTRLSEYERRSGKICHVRCNGFFSPSQQQLGPAVEKALQDLENENRLLQERLQLVEGKMEHLLKDGQGRTESLLKEQKERIDQLVTSHDQEMAVLTKKLSTSQNNAASLHLQAQLLQEQVESQVYLHQTQMSDWDSALDTLCSDLLQEQQTHNVKTELRLTAEELSQEHRQRQQLCKRQAAQCLRHNLELHHLSVQQFESLLCPLTEPCQRHLNVQKSADTEQQDAQSNLQQLQLDKDEAVQLQELRDEEVARLRAVLGERDRELWLREKESKQEEAQGRTQALHAQAEVLCLKLEDAERRRELLMGSLEALQEEQSGLTKQLEQLRQDNQQLKAALQEAEVRLKAVESEKSQLQVALSEQTECLHQLTLEKQQLTTELDAQRLNLVKLREEHQALKEQHSSSSEELLAHNSKLAAQLTSTRADLERAKTSLRALQGADGHALKVALGMQKRITAKREKIDFLQSRVQILEETTEKLAQEKDYQAMESKHQVQELLFERECRRRLEAELETLHTSERLLKSKTERLDTALHKMSDSFAECQEFIQKQEQEIMRLKLQHALEVKELQGQNIRTTGNTRRTPITSPAPQPTFQTRSNDQTELIIDCRRPSSALELQTLVKELRRVIDEKRGPHTSLGASGRSEQSHNSRKCEVTEDTEGPLKDARCRDIEQGPFPTTDLGKQDLSRAFSADNLELEIRAGRPWCTSSPSVTALGRRSPVHSLLTSDPPTDKQLASTDIPTESPVTTIQILAGELQKLPVASKRDDPTRQTCKKLQSKLNNLQNLVGDLQIKNQEMTSMIKSQERRIRKVKDQNQPLKREAFAPNVCFG
ncbi:coiled-coil domain-containing protein 158 [Electrophorus electricus]|uniref:coiled-coil domain-containing protein 158 n=1 Tax=Electrophorus electricus TaxID=8005 RepID=UPI0015CF96E8|nr:coiled-coil domain-containing protein 158 [Electrophorus electricus]